MNRSSESATGNDEFEPITDWGYWRLGHRSDPDFLEENKFTVTFGSGSPVFERVESREEFDRQREEAIENNRRYHEMGYIVLRYLTSSIHGNTESHEDIPTGEELDLVRFYDDNWEDFEDYIGPKPDAENSPFSWITVRPDGTFPHFRYVREGTEPTGSYETWACPNNPYYTRLMEGRVRAEAEVGIDGAYIDWTHYSGNTCYCDFCKMKFRAYLEEYLSGRVAEAKYGFSNYDEVNPPEEEGDPFWMEWVTFRGYSIAEHHKQLRSVARQYNPHFMLSGNVYGGRGFGQVAYSNAGNMEMLGRDGYHDFLYSEIQSRLRSAPRVDEEGYKVSNAPSLRFLTAANQGGPVTVYATRISPPFFPDPTPQALGTQAQANIAENVANQMTFRETRETPQEATDIYNFMYRNEESLIGSQSTSRIAVLASMNQYLAQELSFTFSFSRVLGDNGVAHVMFVEDDINSGKIEEFDLLVVPYIPLLSARKQQALVHYVRNGGNILIIGNSGQKDEYNLPFENIVLASLFPGGSYPNEAVTVRSQNGTAGFVPLDNLEGLEEVAEAFISGRMDDGLRRVLTQAVDHTADMLDNAITRLENNSPYLEISTMFNRTNNRLLVHLVNYDTRVDGTINAKRNTRVRVAIPEGMTPERLTFSSTLGEMQPINYTLEEHNGRTVALFNADRVNIYALAVFELE
ncbi:MAG: alpha-amylase family protein [Balneolales bacterium]